jgi:hypothetical protein
MSRRFRLSVLAPASSIKFRLARNKSGLGGKEASAAGGGDGSDADRFMAHLKKGLQEFDQSAL